MINEIGEGTVLSLSSPCDVEAPPECTPDLPPYDVQFLPAGASVARLAA